MSDKATSFQNMIAIQKLQADVAELTESLTVGNYFWTMEIINHKNAQIAELQGATA